MKTIQYFIAIGCFLLMSGSPKAQTPSIPFGSNTSYANGLMQKIQTQSQASALSQTWYNYWSKAFIKDCGGGKALVMNDYSSSSAYSEGQGYGMLLAAYQGDKATFDKLVKGYFDNTNSHGVMNWTVTCSGATGFNGATDGDLDAAMALLIANKQWPGSTTPNYSTLATTLIKNIKAYEFTECSGKIVQKAGDYLGGCNCTNPSYYATGYYRAFAKHVTSDAAFWEKAAEDGLDLLLKATHPTTGLNPAWTDASGSITNGGTGDCNNIVAPGGGKRYDYQFDAARTPWRIVVDYLWWGTPKAKQYLDKITAWATSKGINQIYAGHSLDGTAYLTYTNSAFVGAFAIGAMGSSSQTSLDNFYKFWIDNSMDDKNYASGKKLDDNPYFQNSLRTMYHFVASGNFWNPYGTTDNPVSVVTVSLTGPANNASIMQGEPVNMTATASSTQGATITKVEFLVDDVVVSTDNTSPYSYSTSTLAVGPHTIKARATDSNGKTATSAGVSITVTSNNTSVVTVNLTSPAGGANFTSGTNINFAATASTTNGASISKVEFLVGSTVVGSTTTSPYTFSTSTIAAGTHTVTARATDSNGKTATSTAVSITISSGNNSVVSANLTAPTGSSFSTGTTIAFTATASSTNGASISKVEFYINNNLVSTDNSAPYSYSTSSLGVGQHTVFVKAYDSNNQTASSTSKTITITAPNEADLVFYKTTAAITIDGTAESAWNSAATQTLSKVIVPTISSAADLSATFKTLWDDQYFYVLAVVTDDVKINDSGDRPYEDDAVELFFDINNEKGTTYDNNDVQYTFRWNDNAIYTTPAGRSTSNIRFNMVSTTGGYVFEARIPWSTLQGSPSTGKQIGFDIQINDDDNGGGRDGKLAWAAATDDAWQNPSLLGNGSFASVNSIDDNEESNQPNVYPNPFVSTVRLEGLIGTVNYTIVDMAGKVVQRGNTDGVIEMANAEAGVYNLILDLKGGKKQFIKLIKGL